MLTVMKRLPQAAAFAAALACAGMLSAAEAIQSLDVVRDQVKDFLEKQAAGLPNTPRIEVGALDPRLRLPLCPEPLETWFPAGARAQGNVTVGVRCKAGASWSIYVPAQVQVFDRVVVSARPLSRGSVLAAGDVELTDMEVTHLAGGYLGAPDQAIGKMLRRNVQLGAVLGPGLLELPKLIQRGERVQIIARTGGMEVRMEGEALEDGAEGQVIRVRNRSSKRHVEARVAAPGTVEIRL